MSPASGVRPEPDPELVAALAGPARPLSLHESARYLGALRWVELEGFVGRGRQAVASEDAQVAAWASEASLGHAWRAAQLEALLPVSVGVPGVDESTAPPDETVRAAVAGLLPGGDDAGETRGGPTDDAVAALLEAAYRARAASPHDSADKPVLRTLRRLLADLADDSGT